MGSGNDQIHGSWKMRDTAQSSKGKISVAENDLRVTDSRSGVSMVFELLNNLVTKSGDADTEICDRDRWRVAGRKKRVQHFGSGVNQRSYSLNRYIPCIHSPNDGYLSSLSESIQDKRRTRCEVWGISRRKKKHGRLSGKRFPVS